MKTKGLNTSDSKSENSICEKSQDKKVISKSEETKYRINVNSNGQTLTYNNCSVLPYDDSLFIRFSDKFGNVLIYLKTTLISMEEIK